MPVWLMMTLIVYLVVGASLLIYLILNDGESFVYGYKHSIKEGRWKITASLFTFVVRPFYIVIFGPIIAVIVVIECAVSD